MDYTDVNYFLPSLQNKYILHHDAKESSNKNLILRSTLCSAKEVENFIKDFSEATNTQWIVYKGNKACYTKRAYHKTWICLHSSHRKKQSSSRNLKCNSKISVTIRKVTEHTKKKDPLLRETPPLCCKISLDFNHSHNLGNAKILKMKRVSEEVKKQYLSYFDDGAKPKNAKRYYESILRSSNNYVRNSADSSINPTDRQVYHIHNKWYKDKFGPPGDPCIKLLEKKQLYEAKRATVKLSSEGTWAVLIVTALMKRVHEVPSSSEMVFIDTTASCDGTNSALTIMLIVTKAGTLPIAAFLHEKQTTESYIKAFSMLKMHFPHCFGGKKFPAIFMTDDSKAEKNALLTVWDKSMQLLCHFHVAQAEWRWIHTSKEIPKDDKPMIMKHFQSVMYATSEEDLLNNFRSILLLANAYPTYTKRLQSYFERRKEWTSFDRQQFLIRGHNTNNFAEASIRIIKDVVLSRTRALNAVALTDFIINQWESYLCLKLLDFANGRRDSLLSSKIDKTYDISLSECIQVSTHLYLLPSETERNKMHEINIDVGLCTCVSGRTGAFCKHQCFLYTKLNLDFPNVPILNISDRLQFAHLASVESNLDASFYQINSEEDFYYDPSTLTTCNHQQETRDEVEVSNELLASSEEKEEVLKEFKRLLEIPQSKYSITKLATTLKRKTTEEEMKGAITTMALSVSGSNYTRSRYKKIKVQPTSISRRIPKERQLIKRKHKLSKNVSDNMPNAK